METLTGNQVSIRLCDTDGKNYYLGSQVSAPEERKHQQPEERKETEPEPSKPIQVPITVIFNQHARPIRDSDAAFDVNAFTKKAKAKDNSGNIFYKVTDLNLVSYRYTSAPLVSEGDHSLIEFEINPERVGNFMMHVLIGKGKGAVEIAGSPFQVNITKSEQHRNLEEQKRLAQEKLNAKKRAKEEEKRLLKQ